MGQNGSVASAYTDRVRSRQAYSLIPGMLRVRVWGECVVAMSFHFQIFSLAGNRHSGASVGRQVEILIHDNAQEWTRARLSVDPQPGSLQLSYELNVYTLFINY